MAKEDEMLKIAVMAGASRAVKFKEENWKATPEEVLRHVSSAMPEIISNIDSD